MSTLVINSKQALDHLMANISSMDVKQLKNVQIHFEGRMAFPKLKQAMAKKSDPNGRKSFGAVGVFPMGNLSPVNQIGMNAIHAITSRMKQSYEVLSIVPDKNFIKCYKNIQESPVQESGKPHPDFYQNSWWVNMSSGEDFKPKVYKKVAGTIQQVDNADSDAYPGQEVVFVITLYPIGIDPKKPDSKKGVSANLIAVLIKGGGERFTGGDSEVDVNTFGGFSGSLQDFSQGNPNHFSAYRDWEKIGRAHV